MARKNAGNMSYFFKENLGVEKRLDNGFKLTHTALSLRGGRVRSLQVGWVMCIVIS